MATLLNDGGVLIADGSDASGNATAVVELFNPTSATLATTGSFVTPRTQHAATPLANGDVLAKGGSTTGGALASAEFYQ